MSLLTRTGLAANITHSYRSVRTIYILYKWASTEHRGDTTSKVCNIIFIHKVRANNVHDRSYIIYYHSYIISAVSRNVLCAIPAVSYNNSDGRVERRIVSPRVYTFGIHPGRPRRGATMRAAYTLQSKTLAEQFWGWKTKSRMRIAKERRECCRKREGVSWGVLRARRYIIQ